MSRQPPQHRGPRATRPLYQWKSQQFCDWIMSSKLGDSIVYHTGRSLARKEGKEELVAVAHDALEAQESGYVALVQRRIESSYFEYIAQRLAKAIE